MEGLPHHVELTQPIDLLVVLEGLQLGMMLIAALADVADPEGQSGGDLVAALADVADPESGDRGKAGSRVCQCIRCIRAKARRKVESASI